MDKKRGIDVARSNWDVAPTRGAVRSGKDEIPPGTFRGGEDCPTWHKNDLRSVTGPQATFWGSRWSMCLKGWITRLITQKLEVVKMNKTLKYMFSDPPRSSIRTVMVTLGEVCDKNGQLFIRKLGRLASTHFMS